MRKERLYDLALKYKSTKLWKKLYDTEMFALKLPDGEIGYCSVMGELGEHIALAVYVGRNGLDSFRNIGEAEYALSEAAFQESMLLQDCLQCAFENKGFLSPEDIEEAQNYAKAHGIVYRGKNAFPQFVCYKPYRYPWNLRDETEEEYLAEALLAALEVAAKLKESGKKELGFTDGVPYEKDIPLLERKGNGYLWGRIKLPDPQEKSYPSPVIADDVLVARVKRAKKKSTAWACEVMVLPEALKVETEEVPLFPFLLLTVDCDSQKMIPNDIVADYERGAEELVLNLTESMLKNGVPSEILVRDERTAALLKRFSTQTGVSVRLSEDLLFMDEMEEDLLAHLHGEDPCDGPEGLFQMLLEMDQATFSTMPLELLEKLLEMDRQGILPEPLSARIQQLKRG